MLPHLSLAAAPGLLPKGRRIFPAAIDGTDAEFGDGLDATGES